MVPYSLEVLRLTVKSFDVEQRTVSGIASTPEPDRMGDIVEMSGVTYRNPLPLLMHHDKTQPVGRATLQAATAEGIPFTATLPDILDPGAVKSRVDEAWHSIKAGLLLGVSIGFRPLEGGLKQLKSGAIHFLKTEILELSLVTIPSNANASIRVVKALAASGRDSSAVAESRKRNTPMTTAEQIQQLANSRAPKIARMSELMTKASEAGVTLDTGQAEEYDGLEVEVKAIDADLVRARALEASQVAQATPITAKKSVEASAQRGGVVTIKPNVEKGTAFIRAACATLVCKGNMFEAAEYAKRWNDTTPEVALYLKAAVAAGTATDATWAGPLVNQNIATDFIELLRPATILGKIPGLRNVPFNTKVPSQTAGGSYNWVGEAKPKPVGKLAFSSVALDWSKAAGIIVLTEELVKLSSPSAEALVRADMIAGMAQFLDQQFIDPAVAAVAGTNPASITNGAPTAAATANPLADILSLLSHFATNNIAVSGITFIMSQVNALALSFQTKADGSAEFPGIGIDGGSYRGINFVTSQAAAGNVIALQPSLILYADDGGVSIDASREASIQMDSAPMSPADATVVMVSLWQNNLVGLRAERFVNWKRANANAVKYLTAAAYPAPAGVLGRSAEPPAAPSPEPPRARQ